MADYPALNVWTDAYLADTADLTFEEHGAYFLMMMIAWRRPDCALPPELDAIKLLMSRAAKFHGRTFNAFVPGILARFWFQDADGKWRQKRLVRERERRDSVSTAQSERALKRWHGESYPQRNGVENVAKDIDTVPKQDAQPNLINGLTDADAMPAQCHGNATQPSKKESKKDSSMGSGNGAGLQPAQTPSRSSLSDDAKLQRFAVWLAPKVAGGWPTIAEAYDPEHPNHSAALRACRNAARNNGKGWPFNWPP